MDMGGNTTQKHLEVTSPVAGSCPCWNQGYAFLSVCQKLFLHSSFPCHYWTQLSLARCLIIPFPVPLKDLKIRDHESPRQRPPSEKGTQAFSLPDSVSESDPMEVEHLGILLHLLYTGMDFDSSKQDRMVWLTFLCCFKLWLLRRPDIQIKTSPWQKTRSDGWIRVQRWSLNLASLTSAQDNCLSLYQIHCFVQRKEHHGVLKLSKGFTCCIHLY